MKRFLSLLLFLFIFLPAAAADPLSAAEDYAEDITVYYNGTIPTAGISIPTAIPASLTRIPEISPPSVSTSSTGKRSRSIKATTFRVLQIITGVSAGVSL